MKTDLTPALHEAGRALLSLTGTKIVGAGDKADAANLNDDLAVVAKIVDRLVLAIGNAAREHLGLSEETISQHFTDQLSRALEGNATFEIESAGKQASDWLDGTDIRQRRMQAAE